MAEARVSREEAATTPRTAGEAEAMGWTVDRHTYPWCAYIGPRFDPERCVVIATPASGSREAGS